MEVVAASKSYRYMIKAHLGHYAATSSQVRILHVYGAEPAHSSSLATIRHNRPQNECLLLPQITTEAVTA